MNLPPSEPMKRRGSRDERVMLFPSLAYYDVRRSAWCALIQGRVYDVNHIPLATRFLLKGLKRALKASEDELASTIFRERIQGFTAMPVRGRRIRVELAGQQFTLRRKSKRNGAFFSIVKLPEALLPPAVCSDQSLSIRVQVAPQGLGSHDAGSHDAGSHDAGSHDAGSHDAGDALEFDSDQVTAEETVAEESEWEEVTSEEAIWRESDWSDVRASGGEGNAAAAVAQGTIHLIARRGVSIVSDIDDTIKATDVTSRHSMLANTFLRPFAAVDGMAQLYRRWHDAGAAFHYVSSSPWQLFQPLAELCQLSRFPAGSMHLRYFRVRDEMFKRWRPSHRKGKAAIIAGLMKKMPQRQFVLVGDSGERDPEIYRFLARRFPQQVCAILIRQLDAKPLKTRRIEKLESLRGAIPVRLFRDANDLQDLDGLLQQWLEPK